ncbi:N-acetylmuramic acid 6-phosphate etherase [Streptacidiphilus sp. N1-3]|uniref:N-acetylmuramic acid 6-phosphate etherase n=1 Tax=Streptacidiphilus alkalitolerans TaxID=3342712 RepID=A0ABV6WVA2_9ACTN
MTGNHNVHPAISRTGPLPPTEQRNAASYHLDTLDSLGVVELMNREEQRALDAVGEASGQLATVAQRVADCVQAGGRVVLLGAGTSGRLALQEVAELPPTFGLSPEIFHVLAAGSAAMGPAVITNTEDDTEAAPTALAAQGIGPADVVIGLAASGTTPFVRSGIKAATQLGSWTCGIANNPGTPLLTDGNYGVLLDTGPEVLTGSTRLKAGTAQKLALNRITTAAMVVGGRVIENHMLDVTGSNAKLRLRALRIVSDVTGWDDSRVRTTLEQNAWSVRAALKGAGRAG